MRRQQNNLNKVINKKNIAHWLFLTSSLLDLLLLTFLSIQEPKDVYRIEFPFFFFCPSQPQNPHTAHDHFFFSEAYTPNTLNLHFSGNSTHHILKAFFYTLPHRNNQQGWERVVSKSKNAKTTFVSYNKRYKEACVDVLYEIIEVNHDVSFSVRKNVVLAMLI